MRGNIMRAVKPARAGLKMMAALGFALLPLITASPAAAQGFSVVHTFSFGTNDGYSPVSGLTEDSFGNLYGTTEYGGTFDYGTVFKLTVTGGEEILHSFTGSQDGGYPVGGVVLDTAGDIYGTTRVGGDPNCGDAGCGVVFSLSTRGVYKAMYAFKGQSDGAYPLGGLVRDSLGNMYGTASAGGLLTGSCVPFLGCGVVFRMDPNGREAALYTFTGSPDGVGPATPLVRDAAGTLYGTTEWGGGGSCANGAGCGVVFRVDRAGHEALLHSFTGGIDGANPQNGGLTLDSAGNIYGTTFAGGDLSCGLANSTGCGVVFKIDNAGSQIVLYTFTGDADGALPWEGVVLDTKGNLYGTASEGGSLGSCTFENQGIGCGVVFKLSPSGTETILHAFEHADGARPFGSLVFDRGYLYGTTLSGGTGNTAAGVVFKLHP